MGSRRGKNYGIEELKQLCYSVLHVLQNPCVSVAQRAEKFWDRVAEHYAEHKPKGSEPRGKKSLEGKWSDIKHDVTKFIECYHQVEGLQIPGTNSDDILNKAKELYQQNHPKGKVFAFESCYWILRECPKWGNPANDMVKDHSKKSNTSKGLKTEKEDLNPTPLVAENENDNSEPQLNKADNNDSGQSTSRKRPNGRNRAMEEAKMIKLQQDVLKMIAGAQKEMAIANRDRVRIMKNNSIMNLLTLPCDNMQPELADFINKWKLEEAQKLKKRMQQQSAEST